MKKTLLVLCLILFSTFSVFAQTIFVDAGLTYGILNQKKGDFQTDATGPGVEVSFMYYLTDSLGIYDSLYYCMVNNTSNVDSDDAVSSSFSGVSGSPYISINLGPAYRYRFTDSLDIFARGGLNLTIYSSTNSTSSNSRTYLGVGGELVATYVFNHSLNLYLTAGCGLAYDFYDTTSKKDFSLNDTETNSITGIMPFIGIGMRI